MCVYKCDITYPLYQIFLKRIIGLIFFFFFDVDHFLKIVIEFVTIFPLFYVLFFFGPEACGTLAARPGIKPIPPALEGEVLTSGLPGKSPLPEFCHDFLPVKAF